MFYEDNHIKIYNRDCQDMTELSDESVQCVVTSPPYWGLRKYSGEQELIWGGDPDCGHQWLQSVGKTHSGTTSPDLSWANKPTNDKALSNTCPFCGAWKGAYGLEPTPEMYIEHTIEILREIRRVLRKDGVMFWNIGDSYWGGGRGADYKYSNDTYETMKAAKPSWDSDTLKPKDLCLIPFRLAIAAQEDGWWVRSVIIWSKPNPMPESVTDRPTESHEYILLLTKNAKYYWDADAVRESYSPTKRWGGDKYKGSIKKGTHGEDAGLDRERSCFPGTGRNIRSVWEFPTQPYPEAHFAVFPEKLPEICIKAATPEVGCCSKCGAPWERVMKVVGKQVTEAMKIAGCKVDGSYEGQDLADYSEAKAQSPSDTKRRILESMSQVKESNWQPGCKCNADKVPSIVLDPFIGAGTTLWVAKKLNRKAVGYEISEEYCQLAVGRCRQQALL